MEVSKLKVERMKYPHGERRLDILRFIQGELEKNPRFLKDTNARMLSKQYAHHLEKTGESRSIATIHNIVIAMIYDNILVKENIRKKNKFDLRINYLYPGLPLEIVQRARKEDIERISGLKKRLAEVEGEAGDKEVYLDGKTEAIVTKPKEEEPKEEPERVKEPETEEPEEPKEEPKKEPEEPVKLDSDKLAMLAALATIVAKPRPVAEPVEVKQDDKNISLTININLNGIK